MEIVVDTNILFSFFWQGSLTRKILLASDFEFVSPEIALEELENYSDEICRRLKISKQKFNNQLRNLKKIVRFVGKENYSQFLKEAESFSPDKDDSEFFALCLMENCFLWSNDSILKQQNKARVLSTEDIIEIMF